MKGAFGPGRVAFLGIILLVLYLSLYTWNLKTGYLDRLSAYTGLEISSWVLRPAVWAQDTVGGLWRDYVDLVGVREENLELRREVDALLLERARLASAAAKADRLEQLLAFSPPPGWSEEGARVIAHAMGPAGVLETIMVDKGESDGIRLDTPVITPDGVVGRVFKFGSSASTILLLTDPNSRIAVMGSESRTPGILAGQGGNATLSLLFIPQSAQIFGNETLITSGLDGIFPKGLPVARVVTVSRPDLSLFQKVEAEPLARPRQVEEVLLLTVETVQPKRRSIRH